NEPPEVDYSALSEVSDSGEEARTPCMPSEDESPVEAPRLRLSDDTARWSDDPVRMYLTQMAEIPLLSREEEIALAKKIEITRKRFRRTLLACDLAMRSTIETLTKVHTGALPFDRTIKVSLTEQLTKEQIMARMPHNLRTLEQLLADNRADFRRMIHRSLPKAERRAARDRFLSRRQKALTLVEE